jgi:hypothetical protein
MDLLTVNELKTLIEARDGAFVSLYMPTHRRGEKIQEDPVRLKNLLGEAEEALQESGLRAPEAQHLLEPAYQLVWDGDFWQHQSDGLALFLSSEMAGVYRLPLDFEELVVTTGRFHIKPLLPLLSAGGQFYVLALSQNEVRLLQGTRQRVNQIDLENLSTSLSEALRFDDPEKRLQFHTRTRPPGGAGERPGAFHGQGVASADDPKEQILRFFHRVADGLQDLLGAEKVPLVLAGVGYLLPLYREANSYPHILEGGIEGNPEEMSAEALHEAAWKVVEPHFLKARETAAGQYMDLAKTDRASNNLAEVVPAAQFGRVATLFVGLGLQQWGTFDPESNQVQMNRRPKPGDVDLLDLAAAQTLLNDGTVYAVEPREVPGGSQVAAVFRYALS